MDFPKLLISSVLQAQDVTAVMERGLDPDKMPTVEDAEALRFILEFRTNHGQVPSISLFESEFPGLSLPYPQDPASFYAERVVEAYVRNSAIEEILETATSGFTHGVSPFTALEGIRSRFTALSKFGSVGREANVSDDAESRIQAYLRAKQAGGLVGIPTPYATLNNITQGWEQETLVGVGARPKTGKTFFMLWCAWIAYLHGYNVLFFNKEVRDSIMKRRLDAMKFKLDYKALKEGTLTTAEEKAYFEGLRAWEAEKRENFFLFFHGISNLAQAQAKIEELDPDLVIVDGAYLLDPGGRYHKEFEKEKAISRGLKEIVTLTRKPVLYSVQLNRAGELQQRTSRNGVAPIASNNIAGSDAYGQDADMFFALERTPDMVAANQLRVHPILIREDEGDPFDVYWGFKPMETRDLGPVTQFVEADEGDDDFLNITG